ncbi:hypothetical protein ABZ390_18930 [Streptomyces solisilvae]
MDCKVRESRKEQGPRKLQREREEYFRLMHLGFGNLEACRRIGVNPRTGREWRNGRPKGRKKPPRPPANAVRVASGPSRYLTEDERIRIADRLREKATALWCDVGGDLTPISLPSMSLAP